MTPSKLRFTDVLDLTVDADTSSTSAKAEDGERLTWGSDDLLIEDAAVVATGFDPDQLRGVDGRWVDSTGVGGLGDLVRERAALAAVPRYPRSADAGVSAYYGGDYKNMNAAYRKTEQPDGRTRRAMQSLDAGFDVESARTTEDIEVYRGIFNGARAFGAAWYADDLTGLTWTELSPASTTANPAVAEKFTSKYTDAGVRLRVKVPRGTPAMRLSEWGDEAEVLLRPGTRFRVVADNGTVDNVRQLDVEVLL